MKNPVIFFTVKGGRKMFIPENTKRRLVLLNRFLSNFTEKTITSQKIQQIAGWSAAVIRRDISLLGITCGASNGYKVDELKEKLKETLHLSEKNKKCCIVGLGKVGQALLDSSELDSSPFKIVAGFDSNVNRTEVLRSVFPLHPTTKLGEIIREEKISYAILTVLPEEAQSLTNKLCESGIKGIVNYTKCLLTVPPSVMVENVCLLTALETICAGSEENNQ